MNYVEYFWKQTIKEGYKKSLYYALIFGFFVSLQQKYTSLMKIKSQWLLYFRFHN